MTINISYILVPYAMKLSRKETVAVFVHGFQMNIYNVQYFSSKSSYIQLVLELPKDMLQYCRGFIPCKFYGFNGNSIAT